MAWKIYRKENYFFAENTETGLIHDYHAKEVRIAKKYADDQTYSFYHNHSGIGALFMDKVALADLQDETGTPFVSIQAFEDWVVENTGQFGASGSTTTQEFDLVLDEWLPFKQNGQQYYRQYQNIVDNSTGARTITEIWKDSNDNIVTALTPPYEIGFTDCASKKHLQLFERKYVPANPFLNGTFSDPSTTSQQNWTQISGTEQWTFNGGVAQISTLMSAPNMPALAHSTYFVNQGKTYTLSFEARGIDNPVPVGNIASTLLVGVDGNGPIIQLTDDVWRTYTHEFSTTNLGVSIGFSRDLTSMGLEIRNVQVTQNNGDHLCVPFIRFYDGTVVTNTGLDFTTPYTVENGANVSYECSECDCEVPTNNDYTVQLDTLVENTSLIKQSTDSTTEAVNLLKQEQESTNTLLSQNIKTFGDIVEHFQVLANTTLSVSSKRSISLMFKGDCNLTIGDTTILYENGDVVNISTQDILNTTLILNQITGRTVIVTLL